MKIHKLPGFFIDIEGIDGSGSSTQVDLVSEKLKKMGLNPLVTKEPTDGPVGKLVHQFLSEKSSPLSATSKELLFAADRSLHLDQVIIPRLEKKEMVITDRYAWSSVAYGSVFLSKEWLFDLNRDLIFPDITIFIDADPEICLRRLAKEKGGFELYNSRKQLYLVWDTYHWLASKYWWAPILVVDGEREKEEICAEILNHIQKNPKFKKHP